MYETTDKIITMIDQVRNSATEKDCGYCSFRFSQNLAPVKQAYSQDPATRQGICQALTNRWIADHANNGSMWNRLMSASPRNRVATIDINQLKRLVQEQKAHIPLMQTAVLGQHGVEKTVTSSAPSYLFQFQTTERWLASQGVIPNEDPLTKCYGSSVQVTTTHIRGKIAKNALGFELAVSILGSRSSNGHYLNIGLGGQGGGHTVGVYVGRPDMLYFDANFGEFWFPSKEKFLPWLANVYNRILHRMYNYDSFWIHSFAKKARQFPS